MNLSEAKLINFSFCKFANFNTKVVIICSGIKIKNFTKSGVD